MASLIVSLSIFSSFLLFVTPLASGDSGQFHFGETKETHLHFYFHDTITPPPKPTAVRVAGLPGANISQSVPFGDLYVVDDPLTEGPDLSSKLLGRAQGIFVFAAQDELALLMTFNLVFVEGKHNGSTLTMVGRNAILSEVREMPIIGGSGCFRGARGYALARTYTFDRTTNNAVVEYNVYVSHM